MGPEQWKDEVPRKEAEERPGREQRAESVEDAREEEGWSQPESSAQKLPPESERPD
jgi:hypothetical protein